MKSKILSLLITSFFISLPGFAGKTLGEIEKEFEGNAKCLHAVKTIGGQYKRYEDLDYSWVNPFNLKDQQKISK